MSRVWGDHAHACVCCTCVVVRRAVSVSRRLRWGAPGAASCVVSFPAYPDCPTQAARLRDAEADARAALQTAQRAAAREAARAEALAKELTACKEDSARAARMAADDASRAASEASVALSRARAETAARAEEAARAQAQASEAERARQAAVVQRDAALSELEALRRQAHTFKHARGAASQTQTMGEGHQQAVLALPPAVTSSSQVAPAQEGWLASLQAAAAAAEAANVASAQARMQATGSTPPGGLASLQDVGSTTKPKHHHHRHTAKPASNGDTHAATDVEAQQLQALATLKDLQVQGLNLGQSRRGAGRGVQEAGIHEDEDMPPRPDSAASNHSWSSLAESDPPSPTELQVPVSVNRPQQQQQQKAAQAQPQHAKPADATLQQPPQQQQQQPQGRSMGTMVDVRGPEARPGGEHGAQMPLRSLAVPPASHGSQLPPQTHRGPPSAQFTSSSDSRFSAPQPQSNGNGSMMSQQQHQQQQQQQRSAPPPPPPPQHTGPPVEHWHDDEDPWSSKPRMDSVAYQQWLQVQARRAAGSAPAGSTPWQTAAHAMIPSQRPPPAGRGGWTSPSNAGHARYSQAMQQQQPPSMQQQSQYDSLRPGPPVMQQGQQQQMQQQQGLPRGYYADDYDPQSGALQRSWSGGSGQVRGILRASSYNQMPSAHPSWGSNTSGDQQWSSGQMQPQRGMSINGRGPPMGQQGMYPGGHGSQPGMHPMQRGGPAASPMRGNSFGPPGPNSWGPPSQRQQQQQQQWLSRDDVGGPYQQEGQYPPNRRPMFPGQQGGGHMDRAMSMPAYSM